jgi:hypothetical protein
VERGGEGGKGAVVEEVVGFDEFFERGRRKTVGVGAVSAQNAVSCRERATEKKSAHLSTALLNLTPNGASTLTTATNGLFANSSILILLLKSVVTKSLLQYRVAWSRNSLEVLKWRCELRGESRGAGEGGEEEMWTRENECVVRKSARELLPEQEGPMRMMSILKGTS